MLALEKRKSQPAEGNQAEDSEARVCASGPNMIHTTVSTPREATYVVTKHPRFSFIDEKKVSCHFGCNILILMSKPTKFSEGDSEMKVLQRARE